MVLFSFWTINFTSAQVNLTDGLVFHLPLDNNTLDVSGNNNDGTGQNIIVQQNRFGSKMKAANFDGANSNGIISMGNPLMNSLTDWSMSYWFRINNNSNGMSLVGQDNSIETGYYTNSNRVIVYHPTFGSFSFAISSPTSWNHVVITGDNSAIRCYLNGSLVRTELGNYTAVSTSHNFNIGGNVVNQSNNSWLRGRIDDVRLYSRAINADEVSALYEANTVEVTVTSINQSTFCPGETIEVNYNASGLVLPGNEFLLELSDLNGDFVDNIEIGKITSTNTIGSLTGIIPEGVQSGTAYRVRVSSTNVMSAGTASSQTITLQGVVGDIPDPSLFRYIGESNGRMYYRSLNTNNLTNSIADCNANGGHLANIGDQNDQNLLFSYISSNSAWFGLIRTGGVFNWQNDFSSAYTNWHPSQPGSLNQAVMRLDNGRWNGLNASQERDFFLQLEPAGLNTTACENETIALNPGSLPGADYLWSGPGGFSSNDQSPSFITNAGSAGPYNLNITNNGCSSGAWETNLVVNPEPPNKSLGTLASNVCEESTGTIFVLNSESVYSYALLDENTLTQIGASQNGNNDTLFFSTNALTGALSFVVRATDVNTGCERIMDDVVSIATWPLPDAPVVTGDEICNGGNLTLSATGGNANDMYNWYTNASLTNLAESNTTGVFETDSLWVTTNFFVTITDQNGCESEMSSVAAQVNNPLSPDIDLFTGLLVHYTYEGNTQDQSGNNINASIVGSNSSYVDDRFGNTNSALNLDGNTYTTSGNPPQVGALTNQVTISMWIRQTPSNWGFVTPLLNKWQNNGLFVGLNSYLAAPNQPNENRVRWRVNNGTVVNSNTNVPFNQWHHIVCTYNGAQLRVYQNGVLTGQANHTGTITNTITNLEFGRQANGLGNVFYRGDADDVRLYNRALTPDEINVLFNNGSVAFANSPLCEGDDIILSAPAFSGATYSWTGPNTFTSADQNPSPITNADSTTHAGIYSLEVERNGCTSLPQNVDVVILPTPLISSVENDTLCGPGNATLNAFTNNPSADFVWYTQPTGGTPINGATTSQLILNNVTQNESRYVSVVSNGCESPRVEVTAVYYDEIDNTSISLTGPSSVCDNENVSVLIQNSQNNVTYEAVVNSSFTGDAVIGNGGDITLIVNSNNFTLGNNLIELTASTPGCGAVSLTQTLNVTVDSAPVSTITSSSGVTDICNGAEITLNASAGDSYLWNTGETTSSIQVDNAGSYTVTITASNGCQSESIPFEVQEITLSVPTITVVGSNEICDGQTVLLDASGGTNYNWNTGQTSSSIVVDAAGNYTVTNTEGTCAVTSNPIEVVVLTLPQISIAASATEVCEGEEVILTASGADTYVWSGGITNGNPFVPTSTSTYTVVGEGSNGCENTQEITISVNPLPTITIQASSTEICEGEELTLTAIGATSYSWTGGVTNGVPFTPFATTNFDVIGEDANGCSSSASITITVNELPTTSLISGNQFVQCNSTAESYSVNGSTGATFLWSVPVGATIVSGQGSNEIVVDFNGSFGIISVVETNEEGCEGDEQTLTVECNLGLSENGIEQLSIYPNPTSNSSTIYSSIIGESYAQVTIYDGTGRAILSTRIKNGEDINMSDLSPGTYFGVLFTNEKQQHFKLVKK